MSGRTTGTGRTKREAARLLVRRTKVFERWRNGESQTAIAKNLAVSIATVCIDVQLSLKEWREEHRGNISDHTEQVLQALDHVYCVAEKNFERSERELVEQGKGKKPKLVEVKGDPRFLVIMLKAYEDKRKLLGLDQPARTENKNTTEVTMREFVPKDVMHKRLSEMLDRFRSQQQPSAN